MFELIDDFGEGRVDVGDGAFRVIGPLFLQTATMLDELFTVELD
jgi:hypothetical protein